MASIKQFKSQLEALLIKDGMLLDRLTYKGAPLSEESKLHNFKPSALAPRFVASYAKSHGGDADFLAHIKSWTRTTTLHCRPSMRVKDLKEMIEDEDGMPCELQRLVFANQELEDDRLLAHYGLQHNSAVRLMGIQMGGCPASFVNVSNSSSLIARSFSQNAPRWRRASRGLNVEGICRNSGCTAHSKTVVDMKGMVSFSLLADKACCPECSTQFQPTTCGFVECMWAFDGRKVGRSGPEDVSGDWKEASGGVYHRFQEQGNTVLWHSLILTTRPLSAGGGPCPICFEDVTDSIHSNGCSHSFHAECLKAWNRIRPKQVCPICLA